MASAGNNKTRSGQGWWRTATGKVFLGFTLGSLLLALTWSLQGRLASREGNEAPQSVASAVPEGKVKETTEKLPANPRNTRALTDVTSPGDLLGSLGIVIGAAVLLLIFLKRFMKRSRLLPTSGGELRLVDALPLGAQRHIYVISFKNRTLVVAGAGNDSLNLLADYEKDPEATLEDEGSHRTVVDPEETLLLKTRARVNGSVRGAHPFKRLVEESLSHAEAGS